MWQKQALGNVFKNGFTLIEVVILTIVLGIITAVALTAVVDLTAPVETATFMNYHDQLTHAATAYKRATGKNLHEFKALMATVPNTSPSHYANQVPIALLRSHSGKPLCDIPTATTLVCADARFKARTAVYTLNAGIIHMVLWDKKQKKPASFTIGGCGKRFQ
jgi:type II secretory pathway pseudopilin PulG